MSNEKMREDFEDAFTEEMVARCGEGFRSSVRIFFVEKELDGSYSNPIAHAGWWAWQSSRDAVVVELPYVRSYPANEASSDIDYYIDEGRHEMKSMCRKAIETAGIKVKP